jgi:integrase
MAACSASYRVNEVTRPMLGEVLTKLRNRGVSQSALCHVRNPLKKYFENLVETGSLVTSPAGDLKHFMGRQRRKRSVLLFFTEKEGPVLLGAAKAFYPRWHAFIMTSMLAGVRWGEVAALQRGDIDFKRGRLHVQRTVSGANEIEAPKDHESRHVKAPKALLAALEAHLWAMGEDANANDWAPEQRMWVFPTERGKPITYRCFHTIWIDLLKRAKLPFRRYHSTRHTYATWSLENGGDIRFIQQQLGHSSIKMTVDTYGHLIADKHEHTVEALNALVK